MKKLDRLKTLYKKVWDKGVITKNRLAEETGLSVTAVSLYINELVDLGWIMPRKKADSNGGRRAVIYQINPRNKYIIGFDFKDSHFYIFLSDLKGNIIKTGIYYLDNCSYDFYKKQVVKAVKSMLEELSLESEKILSIGISVSGITDFDNTKIDRSNQLDWTDVNLADDLEAELNIKTFVGQDVRIYAYNELDSEDPYNITTALFIGTGIGLAVIINNKILKGYTNRVGDNRFFGPELDNLNRIIRTDEYLQEISQLPYHEGYLEEDEIENINKKYREFINKNKENKKELNDFTGYIASMMLSTIALLNPKKVLLTGNIFDYNDIIYNQVKEKMSKGKVYHSPEIIRSKSQPNALENAVLKFIMHKFTKLDDFTFDGSS